MPRPCQTEDATRVSLAVNARTPLVQIGMVLPAKHLFPLDIFALDKGAR